MGFHDFRGDGQNSAPEQNDDEEAEEVQEEEEAVVEPLYKSSIDSTSTPHMSSGRLNKYDQVGMGDGREAAKERDALARGAASASETLEGEGRGKGSRWASSACDGGPLLPARVASSSSSSGGGWGGSPHTEACAELGGLPSPDGREDAKREHRPPASA